jgi:hypothetical protein
MAQLWHMRTTIELPDNLLNSAKSRAAAAGVSLRQFFIEAVQNQLAPKRSKIRTEPPVIGQPGDPSIPVLSGEELDEIMFG